jgi:hypothetical protein
MDITRREMLLAGGSIAGGIGLASSMDSDYSDAQFTTVPDVDRFDKDYFLDLRAFAEIDGLESLEIQYRELGEEWETLETAEPEDGEAVLSSAYTPDSTGEYEFRAVAHAEDTYRTESEYVEFMEDVGTDVDDLF